LLFLPWVDHPSKTWAPLTPSDWERVAESQGGFRWFSQLFTELEYIHDLRAVLEEGE